MHWYQLSSNIGIVLTANVSARVNGILHVPEYRIAFPSPMEKIEAERRKEEGARPRDLRKIGHRVPAIDVVSAACMSIGRGYW